MSINVQSKKKKKEVFRDIHVLVGLLNVYENKQAYISQCVRIGSFVDVLKEQINYCLCVFFSVQQEGPLECHQRLSERTKSGIFRLI